MCGIVGAWRLDGAPLVPAELEQARDTLLRRGPDDAGIYVDGSVGLGHRRLSIIDLSPAGRMPMCNETADVWAVFNGEIYNFSGLRAELLQHGHVFKSRTDSEVVIHAYEQWGADCFARFEGMFAIAIWDARQRTLTLARDAAGEKPLYYHYVPGSRLYFGSTLAPLLAWRDGPRSVSEPAVRTYASFGFVPSPGSILSGVNKLGPGSFAVFSERGEPRVERFWSLEERTRAAAAKPRSLVEAAEQLHALLRGAVRSRMVADVPLGAFLSGGIDSSLVVALMAEHSQAAVRTFTIGFREPEFDESAHAARIAKQLGVDNTVAILSANDVLAELEHVVDFYDEPMADYSVLPGLAVSKLARQSVTVALTGDGADEAFGGYRYYVAASLFEAYARVVPRGVRRGMAALAARLPSPKVARILRRTGVADAAEFFGLSGFYRGGCADSGLPLALPLRPGERSPQQIVADYVRSRADLRPIEAGMLWDATRTLADAWLTKVDRASMAFGLEARAPLLDRQVLEFAFALPFAQRVRRFEKKAILRRILARYLPRKLFDRPKQGFTAPMRSWFARELKPELHDRLAPGRVRALGFFDEAGVAQLLREQGSGARDHTQLLWALLLFDRWYERYIERKAEAT